MNPPDGKHVSGLDSRYHARTGDTKPDTSESVNDFGRQLESECVPRILWSAQEGRAASYDFFLLDLQGPLVPPILPQAKAIVSNTGSCRKLGLW